MALIHTPESAYGKELGKWEKPYKFEPYPKMLYRAKRPEDGSRVQASDQIIVASELEESNMKARGYVNTPDEAIAAVEQAEDALSDLTAARHFSDRRMSPQAQAEAREADRATDRMVPEVPRKRGRPKTKAVPRADDSGV